MLQKIARFLSAVTHPLLMVTYMLILLLLINPYQFGVYSIVAQWKLIVLVFLATFFMPLMAVVLMRILGLVKTLSLDDRYQRIGPYIVTGAFYLWMFVNVYNKPGLPRSFSIAVLGATIALFVCFFINNFTKISTHAAGMGGLTALAAINSRNYNFDTFTIHFNWFGTFEISTTFVLLFFIVLSGLVLTARLYLKAHTEKQTWLGFATGLLAQWIAFILLK